MRWIVGAVSVVLMLVLVVVGAVALIPTDRVAALASQQFQKLTGRALVIDGAIEPTVWPSLGVRTGPVRIDNADWSDEGPMFQAEALAIDLNLTDLIAGTLTITSVEAVRPRIVLERARDGRENWVFGGGGSAGSVSADTPGVGQPYTLAKGLFSRGSFLFIDHGAGTRLALDALDVAAAIPDFAGPATLSAQGVMNGQPLAIEAEVGVYSAFTEGRVVPLSVQATVGGSEISFSGRGGITPMVAEGDLSARMDDLAALAALAGAGAPSFPKAASVAGALTLAKSGLVSLRGGKVTLDAMALTGDADLSFDGPRPKLTAQLAAGALALPIAAGTPGGGADQAAAGGWSTQGIDVSALGAMDAAVSLTAEALDLGAVTFGPTRLKVTVDRARAVFDIARITAYGGTISGQFVTNGRGGLSVGGDLRFAGLAMQPLLTDAAGYDRLIGQGDLSLRFLAVGNSVDALMRSLKGDGALSLGKGELRGLDVAGMLRTLDPNYVGEGQRTIFDGVSATFTMAEGNLSNSDLRLVAPYVTATGLGTVGIGDRVLNYRLRPTALAQADGTGGVMVPLLITGTWAAPKFRLDLESIAREKMEAEAKALEARAKERAREVEAQAKARAEAKLKSELGIEAAEGESLEDAARRRAQEALDGEARRLLDGLLGGN